MALQQMKYIIYGTMGEEIPIIFDQDIPHDQIAKALGVTDIVISAGFLMITPKGAKCYGESITLNRSSRPEDGAHINQLGGDNFED